VASAAHADPHSTRRDPSPPAVAAAALPRPSSPPPPPAAPLAPAAPPAPAAPQPSAQTAPPASFTAPPAPAAGPSPFDPPPAPGPPAAFTAPPPAAPASAPAPIVPKLRAGQGELSPPSHINHSFSGTEHGPGGTAAPSPPAAVPSSSVAFPEAPQQSAPVVDGGSAWAQPAASPAGTPIADDLMRRMRHGDPLARRVGRGMRRAVGARAAQAVREQEAAAGILGQAVSSCRRIAVTSIRGGAGKTTVTALVARTIAAHRGDRTLVLDADPSLGSLPLRLGVNAERTYRGASTLPTWDAAQAYLTQAGERLWVASASSSRTLADELTLAEYQTAQGELSRYFGVCLVDCGPGLTSDLHQGILASAHAQILIVPATADGALSTRSALDWFHRGPYAALLQRTLVVLVTHTPHADGDLTRSRALLAAEGLPVIHLPYDRHLAAGTSVDPALLAESSQATAVHLATAAFTRALS
jgi:MinD-like ATPase involved in chromosome partitioning or flagellar assembly